MQYKATLPVPTKKLDRGIFLPEAERLVAETKPLSRHMSKMLKMQDSLLKASAKELLRADLLHVSAKQLQTPTEYPIDFYVLVHYRSGHPPSRLHTSWRGPMCSLILYVPYVHTV